ncbi:hypothetical protein R8871_02571 [Paraburkholderia graminis C4D1M]|uniref:Uncharacterized protein n=1 Tax=Paraburkholderia graminis (strain ATCC 700544 / DSM 17151 / LMG 18924 / NCIMB 13744 / C4D1M) TaxID=396598 RepID=B1G964_PARG4|nr:hypothetical protein [Paraburkholderia graminis]EDT07325.1 hypothetical protein BgramDRAFT_5901 [Paraburkholderia graminis C4D1M]CAB3682139.1 hypothetical protein R8871_02571 [Paraburkholderia graminis C4D1M]
MHAIYQTEAFNLVAITDLKQPEAKSVTNDIENVLAALVDGGRLIIGHPCQRVRYCDSDGSWDQVVIDAQCQFVRFAPISSKDGERQQMTDTDPRSLLATLLLQEMYYGGQHGDAH